MNVRHVLRIGLVGLVACITPACSTLHDWFGGPYERGESKEVEFETQPEHGNVYVFTAEQWAQFGGDAVRSNLGSMQRWYRGQAPLKVLLPDWRHVVVGELDGRTAVATFTPGEKPQGATTQVISLDLRAPNVTAPAPQAVTPQPTN